MDGISALATLKALAQQARIIILYEKLHVRTNTGAVAKALRERLI